MDKATRYKNELFLESAERADFSPWPLRFAVLMQLVTFPLIWVGGLVTTYDAGMAVPDWPNTYGYNLFLYPVETWVFGPWDLFIEHGHRLLGSLAGLMTIGFLVAVIWKEDRRWMIWLAIFGLLLVIGQGLLGGLRVVAAERFIAKIHGCVGPAFFAYSTALMVLSSRYWRAKTFLRSFDVRENGIALAKWCALALCVAAYLQLVLGAHLRHVDETASANFFTWLVITHISLAFGVFGLVGFLAWMARNRSFKTIGLRRPIVFLCVLVFVQISLGFGTWIVQYGFPTGVNDATQTAGFTIFSKGMLQANITTAHVAVGSLVLATSAFVMLRIFRVSVVQNESSAVTLGLE